MNRIDKVLLSTVLAISGTVSGCGPGNLSPDNAKETVGEKSSIFSERPSKEVLENEKTITIVRLNQPALLETATDKNGDIKLDPKAIEAVNSEQEEFLIKLKKIIPSAKVIYQYKLTLNAIAIAIPYMAESMIKELEGVHSISKDEPFGRPEPIPAGPEIPNTNPLNRFAKNSVKFIGANLIHQTLKKDDTPITGTGIKVGVIDTGVDYTHKMLGGTGLESDYRDNDGSLPSPHFPNNKVVGGIDLVGAKYNSGAAKFEDRLPQPDLNPIDKQGHGTHVAGTIAGIGDDINTYSGVAPQADIYAIKVFGDSGYTSDTVVIAALEWALDPNSDLDLSDRLDVVNLSLGGGFGKPHILYTSAISNFVKSGSVVVASAGNSGSVENIVGAPSTADDAISVAASIDNSPHNWQFQAIELITEQETIVTQLYESNISEPVENFKSLQEELVYIGLALNDLDPAAAQKLNGKIALIDRGKVSFVNKLAVAQKAGAKGAIVVNHEDGDPIYMSGEVKKPFPFPAAMIDLKTGTKIKQLLHKGQRVKVSFYTDKKVQKRSLIDSITRFSSKGPRSLDSLLKPEISAPGQGIISAAVGKGALGTSMNGTSMAAPHIAGVMALLKQYHPTLTALELKSLLLGSSTPLKSPDGKLLPISLQGAGRVQAFKAATLPIASNTPTVSLGEILIQNQKSLLKQISVRNISDRPLDLSFEFQGSEHLQASLPETIQLIPNVDIEIPVRFDINANNIDSFYKELNGYIIITTNKVPLFRIPVLGVINKLSSVKVDRLEIFSTSKEDSAGAYTELHLKNESQNPGEVLIFNHLGTDQRKAKWSEKKNHLSSSCDLESFGYRIVQKKGEDFLQIATKLYNPVTKWQHCEIAIQIDGDLDGNMDQEIVGISFSNLAGLDGNGYVSLLLDSKKAKEIRHAYDESRKDGKPKKLDFKPSILALGDYVTYDHSTVSVVEAPVSLLSRTPSGELRIKAAVISAEGNNVEEDDFLANQSINWESIQIQKLSQSYYGIPDGIKIPPHSTQTLTMTKGEGEASLMLLYPNNRSVKSQTLKDNQLELVEPIYRYH